MIRMFNKDSFIVCPRCGYGNITFVRICGHCNFTKYQKLSERITNLRPPSHLEKEKKHYDKVIKNNFPPNPIVNGIGLSANEYILIYIKCSYFGILSIIKNHDRFQVDANGYKCSFDSLILTNEKIYFIATSLIGGWRKIESFRYDEIKEYHTEKRKHYNPILDENDKLAIKITNNDVVTIKGTNPNKYFLAICKCIKQRETNNM